MYLDALGQPMIVLGSHEAALDLLEKRSSNYSDRTPSPMVDMYVVLSASHPETGVLTPAMRGSIARVLVGLLRCSNTGRGGDAIGVRSTSTSTRTP